MQYSSKKGKCRVLMGTVKYRELCLIPFRVPMSIHPSLHIFYKESFIWLMIQGTRKVHTAHTSILGRTISQHDCEAEREANVCADRAHIWVRSGGAADTVCLVTINPVPLHRQKMKSFIKVEPHDLPSARSCLLEFLSHPYSRDQVFSTWTFETQTISKPQQPS